MNRLILASQSASRKALLQGAGVPFEAVSPGVDEDAVKAGLLADGATPRDIADKLAETKAVKVSGRHPEALVIGADQTMDFQGRLYDKPESMAAARVRLQQLRGHTHALHAGVVVAQAGASCRVTAAGS